jgi:hypothetical protein
MTNLGCFDKFVGLLICTLISENQGLIQTLEKISGPANMGFFLGLHLKIKARFIP